MELQAPTCALACQRPARCSIAIGWSKHAHISIVDAIADRDSEAAGALARQHLLTLITG